MTQEAATTGSADGWRQRSVERSLRNARAKAELRSDRFIRSALAILGETGRTDFTVQEVVERSKTSLRAFYQHFGTKDELLLALVEELLAQSANTWRQESQDLRSTDALRLLVERISAQPDSATQHGINRALSLYNQHLAETRPRDYARVLSPLHQLFRDVLDRGVDEGTLRPDLDTPATAAIVMHTVLGALRLHTVGTELAGAPVEGPDIYDFCLRGLQKR